MQNRQYCLTLKLHEDDELIALYEKYHRPGGVWPEVLVSIKESGILDMRIYRRETLLIMVLETIPSFSFEAKARLDAANPKVQEWERLMERFQDVDDFSSDKGKWSEMTPIFEFDAWIE